ncbi:hypothetical protein MNEG_10894 [Monoraphidium neglectum]|uniref:DUF1764-domain-containing protein n=1 Tax=Monoraphidium neglectum TaxID=145388 RepID=A0A0D2JBD5_9CHLO|nr:hypothetical protein MNEG_10894 [Monoraphidium neglectum]KIY97067.1 hypothetical protein MNEG_10894 [Monoraphidium neglectum]|eukprot:XP_013896087.1 hypothetical protein MNEG_10894 [Monoraphidium neglectum]
MTKKAKATVEGTAKHTKQAPAAVEPTKEPPSAEKKATKRSKDEIDDIFSSKPPKKVAKAAAGGDDEGGGAADVAALSALAAQVKSAREKQQGQKAKVEGSKDDIFGQAAGKARKKTEEGFTIYTEDELGLGSKGGNTDKCPFDCECCF